MSAHCVRLVYLHDVIGSVNVIVSTNPEQLADLQLSHVTLSIPLADRACYRRLYRAPPVHCVRTMTGHSIRLLRRLHIRTHAHMRKSETKQRNIYPICLDKRAANKSEMDIDLPGFRWPS